MRSDELIEGRNYILPIGYGIGRYMGLDREYLDGIFIYQFKRNRKEFPMVWFKEEEIATIEEANNVRFL